MLKSIVLHISAYRKIVFITVLLVVNCLFGYGMGQYKSISISTINGLSNNSVTCIYEDAFHTLWVGTWGGLNAYNGRDIKNYRYNSKNANTISNNTIRQILEYNGYVWIATDNGVNRLDRKNDKVERFMFGSKIHIPKEEHMFYLGKTKNNRLFCFVKGVGLYYYYNGKFYQIHADFIGKIISFHVFENTLLFKLQNHSIGFIQVTKVGSRIKYSSLHKLCDNAMDVFVGKNTLAVTSKGKSTIYDNRLRRTLQLSLPTRDKIVSVIPNGKEIFVSFEKSGCMVYNIQRKNFSKLEAVPKSTILISAYLGSQNILWLGTDGKGLCECFMDNPLFHTVYSDFPIRSFCMLGLNEMLVGTKGGGIYLYNFNTETLKPLLNESNGLNSNSVYALCKNQYGDVFIGTDGNGVDILSANGKMSHLKISERSDAFKSIYNICFTDKGQVMWLATAGHGVLRAQIEYRNGEYYVRSCKIFSSLGMENSLRNDVVYSLFFDKLNQKMWFGSRGGGLNAIDMNSLTLSRYGLLSKMPALSSEDVISLNGDNKYLWVGTSSGLNIIDLASNNKFKLLTNSSQSFNDLTIHGIVKDLSGCVWFSSNQGLYRVQRNGQVEHFTVSDGLQNNDFSDGAFYIDSNGYVMFGGVSGFNYFNPQHVTRRHYVPYLELCGLRVNNRDTLIASVLNNHVLSLKFDERNIIVRYIAKDFINNTSCEYAYRLDNAKSWIYLGTNPDIVLQLAPGKHTLEVKCTNGDKVWSNKPLVTVIKVSQPWWFSIWAWICYIAILCVIVTAIIMVVKNKIEIGRNRFLDNVRKQQDQKIFETRLAFFSNVAQRIFTPLTLIYSPIHYLSSLSGLSKEAKKYIDIIKENAEKMQYLTQAFVENPTGKDKKEALFLESFDNNVFIDSVIDSMTVGLNDINIERKLHDLHMFTSDKEILSGIIYKLLSNALEHTYTRGSIAVEAHQLGGDYSYLVFVVVNTQHGSTHLQIQNLFRSFDGLDSDDTKRDEKLQSDPNLSKIREDVELLHGKIELDTNNKNYFKVCITIPSLSKENEADVILPKSQTASGELITKHESYSPSETRILLVEDNLELQEVIQQILKRFHVTLCSDLKSAAKQLADNTFEIVIVDLNTGNLGTEAISKLKVNASYVPFIAIAKSSSMDEQIEVYKNGADFYISKPFRPEQLTTGVENILDRSSALKEYYNSNMSSITIKDGKVLYQEDVQMLYQLNDYIMSNISNEELSAESLCRAFNFSRATLYRKFKELTGKTPSEYIKIKRLDYAAKLLLTSRETVSEIIFNTGFSNKSYFYREFKSYYGCSPSEYRIKYSV